MRAVRVSFFLTSAFLAVVPACQCDDLGSIFPAGSLVPSVYELGPITTGQTCTAKIGVRNKGNADLNIEEGSGLENVTGGADFKITKTPSLVRLGATEDMLVRYIAGGEIGDVQSATISLKTDDPDNEGVIKGTITAIVSDGLASVAKTRCDDNTPCAELAFGATQVAGAGITLTVEIVNDGTADMQVQAAGINGDINGTFSVEAVRRGSTVLANFPAEPAIVPAGRTDDCGKKSDADNTLLIDVHYTPTQLGADVGTLFVATDAIVGRDLEVPLSGLGSDTGILTDPAFISFGELAEGSTRTIDVRVENVGTQEARVDVSCIDVDGDDSCDANCTGNSDDTALGGTLSCSVTTAGGNAEGYGFVLDATDAQQGGGDERNVHITWAPVAGSSAIPSTAVLALHSNILGNRVFEVPVRGGALGELIYETASDDVCQQPAAGFVCLEATGDPLTTTTWVGDAQVRLTNEGAATLTILSVAFEPGSPTIEDDFTLGAPSTTTLAPNGEATFDIDYANNDASQQELINIIVTHDGEGGLTTIPLAIVPPA